jgi:hypothetical protein
MRCRRAGGALKTKRVHRSIKSHSLTIHAVSEVKPPWGTGHLGVGFRTAFHPSRLTRRLCPARCSSISIVGQCPRGVQPPAVVRSKPICDGLTAKHLGMLGQLRSSRRASFKDIAGRQHPMLESSWSQSPLRLEDCGLPRDFRGVRALEWIFQFSDRGDQGPFKDRALSRAYSMPHPRTVSSLASGVSAQLGGRYDHPGRGMAKKENIGSIDLMQSCARIRLQAIVCLELKTCQEGREFPHLVMVDDTRVYQVAK